MEPETTGDDGIQTRLYATYNGLFAGYVRDNAGTITVGGGAVGTSTVKVHADSAISGASIQVKYGNLSFGTGNGLLDANGTTTSNVAPEPIGSTGQTKYYGVKQGVTTINWNAHDSNNKALYNDLARLGRYTIVYDLDYVTAKDLKKTQTFTVQNTVVVPTVTVLSRAVESFADADIFEVLKTNVDMNNNESEHQSFVNVDIANTVTSADNTRYTVRYVAVEDTYGYVEGNPSSGTTWNFWVPINTTFRMD